MSVITTPDITTTPQRPNGFRNPLAWIVAAVWLLLSLWLASTGRLAVSPSGMPYALAIAAILPPVMFLIAHALSSGVRYWVASLDMAIVTGVQTWRVVGAVFLFLWGTGDLPLIFALAAGVGDIAVGVFAVIATVAVARRTAGWQESARTLVIIGMLDFVLAFTTATLTGPGFPLQLAGHPVPSMMGVLPMAVIPAFGVPMFAIFHVIAWLKLRNA